MLIYVVSTSVIFFFLHLNQWREMVKCVSSLMHCLSFHSSNVSANDMTGLKESDEKLKQQQQESARRENILVMRLATKEQEMQECTVCIYVYMYLYHAISAFRACASIDKIIMATTTKSTLGGCSFSFIAYCILKKNTNVKFLQIIYFKSVV